MRSRFVATRSSQLLEFLRTEEASGVFLLVAAGAALIWANSPLQESYHSFWSAAATAQIGSLDISMDLQHWVNEGLMTLFFLVVGLEIKREVTTGELRDPKNLALPVIAAVGGMIVPAALFLLINGGTETAGGWGVPVATDIAFALGILTLAASRAPTSLRSLLLTLAIVDDVGAIVLIAVFYSGGLAAGWLAVAAALVMAVVLARSLRVTGVVPYVFLGGALWIALFEAGINPTLAGVALGLLAPTVPLRRPPTPRTAARRILHDTESQPEEEAEAGWLALTDIAQSSVPPLDRVESRLHPWTSRFVVPAFALANTGVVVSEAALTEAVTSPVGLGILVGLVIGKPIGVGGGVWVARRTGVGRLPDDITSRMVVGVAALAGIGFTVALFIADLAFTSPMHVETAKLAVLLASVTASALGAAVLRSGAKR